MTGIFTLKNAAVASVVFFTVVIAVVFMEGVRFPSLSFYCPFYQLTLIKNQEFIFLQRSETAAMSWRSRFFLFTFFPSQVVSYVDPDPFLFPIILLILFSDQL